MGWRNLSILQIQASTWWPVWELRKTAWSRAINWTKKCNWWKRTNFQRSGTSIVLGRERNNTVTTTTTDLLFPCPDSNGTCWSSSASYPDGRRYLDTRSSIHFCLFCAINNHGEQNLCLSCCWHYKTVLFVVQVKKWWLESIRVYERRCHGAAWRSASSLNWRPTNEDSI